MLWGGLEDGKQIDWQPSSLYMAVPRDRSTDRQGTRNELVVPRTPASPLIIHKSEVFPTIARPRYHVKLYFLHAGNALPCSICSFAPVPCRECTPLILTVLRCHSLKKATSPIPIRPPACKLWSRFSVGRVCCAVLCYAVLFLDPGPELHLVHFRLGIVSLVFVHLQLPHWQVQFVDHWPT
jgi:hypothetical protein